MRKKHYLKGITSIRFFLAMLVVLMHCSQNLKGYDIFWANGAPVLHKGGLAVDYFFTLSGFLLTFLAFAEYKTYHQINIKAFFIRRILRIFPLYYLAVFLGYLMLGVLFPMLKGVNYLAFSISEGLPFHLLFLPNWIIARYLDNVGSLYALWSIGVEEQFYLFFPLLCTFLFKRKLAVYFGVIAIVYFTIYKAIQVYYPTSLPIVYRDFLFTLKFHFMFLGGFFAILFHNYRQVFQEIFSSKIAQFIILLLLVLTMVTSLSILKYQLIYGSIFCLFLVSIANNPNSILPYDHKVLKYLGTISFGIYVYHPIVSYPTRYVLESSSTMFEIISAFPILYYVIVSSLAIVVAHFSYQYYELKFLKMKEKYVQ